MRVQSRGFPRVDVRAQPIIMDGGLDETTPPFQLKPGYCRTALNFESSIFGGYRRIAGYERFDGNDKPSDAEYSMLPVTTITGGAVGDTLTGATSLATGVIIAITATHFVLTKTTGVFQAENVNVGGPTIAVATGAAVASGAATALLHATYKNLAADSYRNDIAAVPGSGNILGVNLYNDVVYAFRNNAGGTAAVMYKSTASGWSAVSFEYYVSYTVGSGSVDDGDTLTQGGVTATVRRVLVRTGTLAAGSAVGTLVISAPAGGNFAAGAATTTGGGTLTLDGIQTAITLSPSGRYEFVNANFTGSTNTKRMYGCDGVNKAFEFDGTYFVPIPTGMTVDTPLHIAFHLYHLFLSFNASVQHSSTGTPFGWTPVTGAAEFAMGDNVTGFAVQPSGESNAAALAVFTTGRASILYGTGSSNWQLVPYKDEIGAFPYTIQNLAQTMFMDAQGITDLATSQSFGNFSHAVVSNGMKNTLAGWRNTVIASSVSRDLSQYRLFFTNDNGVYVTMIGRKVIGVMQVQYPDTVRCTGGGLLSDNTEAQFFGSDNGFVYQLDKGTSFDGANIAASMTLAYNFSGGVRTMKKYRDGALEVSGNGYAAFNLGYSLGYGSTDIIQPAAQAIVTSFASVIWDSFTWDSFTWDGVTLIPSTFGLDGDSENISLAITSDSDLYVPFTVSGGLIHYSNRRELR